MVEVIPAILTNNPQELKSKVASLEGISERVQIDIIDGVFADNKTVDPQALEGVELDIKIDFHLMTKNPVDWVEKCVRSMADRIIGQVELMDDQIEYVSKVQEVGTLVGLALDLKTPVSSLQEEILDNLDVVLVMGVPAGFGGQKFDKKALDKIEKLNKIKEKDATPYKICVDGGVTTDNIEEIVNAGADEVSIGRRLFKGDIKENILKFRKINKI